MERVGSKAVRVHTVVVVYVATCLPHQLQVSNHDGFSSDRTPSRFQHMMAWTFLLDCKMSLWDIIRSYCDLTPYTAITRSPKHDLRASQGPLFFSVVICSCDCFQKIRMTQILLEIIAKYYLLIGK